MPPRRLGDVLHYLIPEASAGPAPEAGAGPAGPAVVAVPVGGRDLVRAALLWNLAVELARLGAKPMLLAPGEPDEPALWPVSGPGPLGVEVHRSDARSLSALAAAADRLVREDRAARRPGALLLVRVPPEWLEGGETADALFAWWLLFASPARRDLLESYALAKLVTRAAPAARVGVTIHGVHSVAEAEATFRRLAGAAARHLGIALASYGLLIDDLHVYRAIVSRRAIGLTYPQSPTARALRDVARLLLGDVGAGGAGCDPRDASEIAVA